jgi:hypothetical protein
VFVTEVYKSEHDLLLVQQMDELQVIVGFVKAAKRLKTVCK